MKCSQRRKMYKLYIKNNGTYKNPQMFESYREAKSNARGEYLIIKEENGTDTIIEHDVIINKDDEER